MGDLIERAGEIIARSQRVVDTTAHNIANLGTQGYKRKIAFQSLLGETSALQERNGVSTYIDFTQGALTRTGSNLDLAISGPGFFVMRSNTAQMLTRDGHFHRDGDGHLLNAEGYALQAAGGGDIAIKDGPFKVSSDGNVLQSDEQVDRIALVAPNELRELNVTSGGFQITDSAATHQVEAPVIQQGMLEASNVSNSKEMTTLIEAMRRAETGQQIAHTYDDLMGKAISGLGG